MIRILPFMSLVVLLAACSSTPESLDAVRSAAMADSVKAEADIIASDVLHQGPLGWLPHFADSAFFMVVDGSVEFPSFDSADAVIHELANRVSHMELVWADERVTALAPGLATFGASYDESVTDTAGATVQYGGYMTATMVHLPDGWRIQNLHWSSPPDTR